MMIRMFIVSLALILSPLSFGQEAMSQAQLQEVIKDKIAGVKKMSSHSLIVKAVKEQNAKNMSLADIKKIDVEWKASKDLTPFKLSLQKIPVGYYIKRKVELNKSIYSEAFLTDNQGANVTAFPATSDYWQGDEAKWSQSFNGGDGKFYIGEVELDESSGSYATQISAPVISEGVTIGVLVIGIKLSYIEARKLKAAP
ncbi:MAG: PDC sensor domain-containing protein [Bermanella sp.]